MTGHSGTALIDPYIVFEKIKLAPGMRVADFGCGRTGHFVFSTSKMVGDDGLVYAVDLMKNVLESVAAIARSGRYDNIQTIWSDVEKMGNIPIPDKSLDACYFVNILFQIKDRRSALREAIRLLKPGGYLAVVDWEKKLGTLGPREDKMVPSQEISLLGQELGLLFRERSKMSDYHYLLIFQKREEKTG